MEHEQSPRSDNRGATKRAAHRTAHVAVLRWSGACSHRLGKVATDWSYKLYDRLVEAENKDLNR